MSAHVRVDDVRQLFRLVAECREIREAGEHAGLHLLRGLALLTRSQIVIRMDSPGLDRTSKPVIHGIQDFGWPTDADRDRIYRYVANTPISADPLSASVFGRAGPVVTFTRAETISSADWGRTELRNDIHRPAGIDESMLSICRKPSGRLRVLAFKRGWGEQPYAPEQRELVDLAHSECEWLLEDATGTATPNVEWTPRERETLELMLTGASEKSIAATLGLSPHTIHDYVKAIYRKIGVGSRAELMARVLANPSAYRH